MARRQHANLFRRRGTDAPMVRRIALRVALVVAALVLLLVIAWFQLLSYLQSDSFRHLLADKLREATAAQTLQLRSKFTIDGDTVKQEGAELAGAGIFYRVQADSINLELNRAALFHRILHINKVSVESGELVLRSAAPPVPVKPSGHTAKGSSGKDSSAPAKPAPKSAKSASEPAEPAREQSFFTPQGYELEQFECRDTDLIWERGKDIYRLLGSTVTATPTRNGWQCLFENGRLHTPNDYLKEASLKTATVQYSSAGTDLSDCRIMLSPGELRAKAHLSPGGAKWSANLALNKMDVRRLLQSDWKQRVSGQLYGKLSLTGKADGISAAEGNLSLQEGVLEGLPMLSEFPGAQGSYPYRHVELDKAECHISYPYNDTEHQLTRAWLFDRITVNSRDGNLLLRGRVIIAEDGTLGGSLSLGLPEVLFSDISDNALLKTIFNGKGESGYHWVNINLSGTIDAPEEDLSVRLSTLLKQNPTQMLKQAGDAVQMLLQGGKSSDSRSQGAEPSAKPTDVIRKAGDTAGDLLESGLKTLF